MLKTLELLENSPVVKSYEVLDFKKGKDFYYLKIKVNLIDGSILHVREYVSIGEISYSYNWMDKDGNLICRWDNAPHYRHIKTFPHHKHTKNGVEEFYETSLEDVLIVIENVLRSS